MSSTIMNALKVQNATNFLELIKTNKVYLWVGRGSEWTDENVPPVPKNNMTDELDARSHIEYMVQLNAGDAMAACPRYNWALNSVYAQYSPNDPLMFTKDFYVITSSNNVYKCLVTSGPSTEIPSGTTVSSIITNDGYTWKFMFDLSSQTSAAFLTSNWIPVPTGDARSNFQIQVENSANVTSGSPPYGHGKDASTELGASAVVITKKLQLNSVLGNDFEHRQFGILVGPKLTTGVDATASSYVIASSPTLDLKSGRFMMLSNHVSVNSNDAFTENVQTVIKF